MSDADQKMRIAERLDEAGLDTARFVDVQDGEKSSVDHTTLEPTAVSGNYGIYALADDRLIILDIDDYDLDDKSGLTALTSLPPTLEEKSPHGGTHRFYVVEQAVDGRLIADVLEDELGKKNPGPSWGEVRVANQYVVGSGSELDGCDKDWCEDCATEDGGGYELNADREIATIAPGDILEVLRADPNYGEDDEDTDDSTTTNNTPDEDVDPEDVLGYAINESNDEKLQRLWRGDYSDYGGDRSRAESALAYKLAFWLQGDREAVRRAMNGSNLPSDVSQPSLEKWSERTDDSYRNSVLSAVDKQTEYFDPDTRQDPDPSTVDYSEVERGEAIMRAEASRTDPAGEMQYENGCYGYRWVNYDEEGNIVDSGFDEVTNFSLETVSKLDTYEGDLLTLRVHPNHPMEDEYEVEVHPTVFNEARDFREEVVRGMTTWFQPSKANRSNQQVLSDLRQTVGGQMAPQHTGTEFIGLHGDDYDEWVTPKGTLTADGWVEDAEYKFYEKGGEMDSSSSLAEKWLLSSDDEVEYDSDAVARICEHLPWTRLPERGLPVLGWYYAAPLKPLIFDEFGDNGERQFNLLQVVGGTGTGKTSTLELYYELFGANPNPYGCGDKGFTIEKKLSGSRGLPIWLDEYKPTDLASRKVDWLHRRFREVFRNQKLSKGRPSLGEVTFSLEAPVVFSGEQVVESPAVRRRTIVTQFSSSATEGDARSHFKELQQLPFRDHAKAYYEYVLSKDVDELSALWDEAGDTVSEYLSKLGIDSLNEDSEVQGLRTIIFGYKVFEEFADAMNADTASLPGDQELRSAIAHVAENIGPDGRRREHIDDYTELVAQAALEDYLDEGVHYRLIDSQKYGGEVLAFHMPSTFSAVKRFMRDYNLEDEYSLLSKNDFLDNYSDKADDESAYPLATNQRVRGLENGAKAVFIDMETASETLGEEFSKTAFTDAGDDGITPLDSLETGEMIDEVTLEVAQLYVDEKPWFSKEGWVVDESGAVKLVVRDDLDYEFDEGQAYRFKRANITEDGGIVAIEPVPNMTEIEEIGAGDGTTIDGGADWLAEEAAEEPEADAAADGGEVDADDDAITEAEPGDAPDTSGGEANGIPEDAEGPLARAQRLVQALKDAGEGMTKNQLMAKACRWYGMSPTEAENALEKAVQRGMIIEGKGGRYEPVSKGSPGVS